MHYRATLIVASICAFAGAAQAQKPPVEPTPPQTEALAQTDKYYWVAPRASMRLCPKPTPDVMDRVQCPELNSGKFLVTHVVILNKRPAFYRIETPDGRVGFLRVEDKASFVDEDPQVTANASKTNCARYGEPKIGMTVAEAEKTCWAKPISIKIVNAANRVREQHVYAKGRFLYFENGVVVAIENPR